MVGLLHLMGLKIFGYYERGGCTFIFDSNYVYVVLIYQRVIETKISILCSDFHVHRC